MKKTESIRVRLDPDQMQDLTHVAKRITPNDNMSMIVRLALTKFLAEFASDPAPTFRIE